MNVIKNKAFRIFTYVLGYISAVAVIAFSSITAFRYSTFQNDIGTAESFAVTESMKNDVVNAFSELQKETAAHESWNKSGLEEAALKIADYTAGTISSVSVRDLAKEAGYADVLSAMTYAAGKMEEAGGFEDGYAAGSLEEAGSLEDEYAAELSVNTQAESYVLLKIKSNDYVTLFKENADPYSEYTLSRYMELQEILSEEEAAKIKNDYSSEDAAEIKNDYFSEDAADAIKAFSSEDAADAKNTFSSEYSVYSALMEQGYTEWLSEGDLFILIDDGILIFSPENMRFSHLGKSGAQQTEFYLNEYELPVLYICLPKSMDLKNLKSEDTDPKVLSTVFSAPFFRSPFDAFYRTLDEDQQKALLDMQYYTMESGYLFGNAAYSFGKDEISGSRISDARNISGNPTSSSSSGSYEKLAEEIAESSDICIRYLADQGRLDQWYKDPSGKLHHYNYVESIDESAAPAGADLIFGMSLYQSISVYYTFARLMFPACQAVPSPIPFLIISAIVFLACVILLLMGVPARLLAIDKVPFEIFLAVDLIGLWVLAWLIPAELGRSILTLAGRDLLSAALLVLLLILGLYILAAGLFTTIARRLKTRSFVQGLLTVTLIRLIFRGIRALFRKGARVCENISRSYEAALSGHKRLIIFTSVLFFINALILVFFGLMHEEAVLISLLIIAAEAFAGYHLLKYSAGAEKVLTVSRRIEAGELEAKTDPSELKYNIKELGESLNRLGESFSAAVEASVRDERTKAELITNVSHDIKTPLTSIISYVDLLKNEKIENERAREYIKVLDQKSQRLKQLIADLIEVSKTNTGNIELERTNLDLAELLDQAVGEYRERMTACGLEPVVHIQTESAVIFADGRRVFRILDNLLNNVTKYAQPGTRVYIDLSETNSKDERIVVLSIRNISREMLNISAEELTERFVRGDRARHTEGSGLGLSIARNLTELQDGTFDLQIDGDLFTVRVAFPAVSQ